VSDRTQLTSVETVYDEQSWLFTVRDRYGELDEVILVPCETSEEGETDSQAQSKAPVEAWVNRCTHEAQRLDRGFGAAMRDGEIICPKHGSMFDACSGDCDNGEAAGTRLVSVDVAVEKGDVYLDDNAYEFAHEGGIEDGESDGGDAIGDDEDDGDVPSSTSHIGL
jgi:nitrite reductase/ring-hydroxylating ferredoxin subunit